MPLKRPGGVEANWLKGESAEDELPYVPNSLKIDVELNLLPNDPNALNIESGAKESALTLPRNCPSSARIAESNSGQKVAS